MVTMGMFSPYGFRALENQNAADTQAANVAPTMPGYTGLDDKTFAKMLTPEDQIHWLYQHFAAQNHNTRDANAEPSIPGYTGLGCRQFAYMRTPEDQIHWLYLFAQQLEKNKITAEVAKQIVDAAISALKSYVDSQDAAIQADVLAKYLELLSLIHELMEFPGVVFDPTWGNLRPIKRVTERVYDFDRPFSVSAGDYDRLCYTAKTYDSKGWTAREFDVTGAMATYQDSLKGA